MGRSAIVAVLALMLANCTPAQVPADRPDQTAPPAA